MALTRRNMAKGATAVRASKNAASGKPVSKVAAKVTGKVVNTIDKANKGKASSKVAKAAKSMNEGADPTIKNERKSMNRGVK